MSRDAYLSEKAEPIFWSTDVWAGDPDGDMTLSFEDESWRVKKDIVTTHFPWIIPAMARAEPGDPVIVCPQLPAQLWEDHPSFFTFVEIYFLAERFRLNDLKLGMAACVEELSRHVVAVAGHHCAHCRFSRGEVDWEEKQHLASFLDAVLVVETQPWSAKMVKAMYDAGDRMKARLLRLPAFRLFVEEFPEGMGFAQAIGAYKLLGRAVV
ncbi:hypothetical protein F5144DRAFT_625370 [Chaetomium tenue]|uniref:Uncharacterized protein n=1 Tax=Chaetomium tenue TaxID=1854479 RepID=A0ACB7PN68_9PEZI|nr:hypothetical protein F5144DRAFT_625370 [Chaetomium globosum]